MPSLTKLAILFGLVATTFAGSVHRDPVTGKWVTSSANDRESDSRASGGDDGGLFGFDFIDNRHNAPQALVQTQVSAPSRPKAAAPISHGARVKRGAAPPMPAPVAAAISSGLRTRERSSKHGKYTTEIPVSQALQTQQNTHKPLTVTTDAGQQALVQQDNEEAPVGPTTVQRVVHEVVEEEQAQVQTSQGSVLATRNIGTLCRYKGVAPLTGCPAEAANGCVDRTPCERSCDNGAYFSWRCQGPVLLTGEEAAEALERVEQQQQEEQQPPQPTSDEHIDALAARIETAIQTQDYASLARAIVDTQAATANSHHASKAAALLQTAFEAQQKAH